MGSSGGSFHSNFDSEEYFNKLRRATTEDDRQNYDSGVASLFSKVLGKLNNRDQGAIRTHVDEIVKALEKEAGDGDIKTNFGGSLSRNTHLNGFSDVDVLVILNETDLADSKPGELLQVFFDRLKSRFPNTEILKGDTAITVCFADIDIQLLPALKYKSGIKIPDGSKWSNIIRPKDFAQSLSQLNQQMAGSLVPTIKLAKAILSTMPEENHLAGYHIESLAIETFSEEPPATLNYKDLLKQFFKKSAERVIKPIKDETGQTENVDDYLGAKNSISRQIIANRLNNLATKMDNADKACLQTEWDEILDIL